MRKPKNRLSVGFLFDDTLDSSDGVAQYVKTLGAWLNQQGHKVSYLVGETKTNEHSGGRVYNLARNVSVVFNGNRVSIPVRTNRQLINRLLTDQRFDILHVQMPYSPVMSQYVIRQAKPSTAVVGTFHVFPASWGVTLGTHLLRIVVQKTLKRFDAVISVSRPAAQFAKQTFKITTAVVPNVVNVSALARAKPKQPTSGGYHVVFLGRLVKRKGCLDLLRAFNLLSKELPNVQLTIAGDGPQRPVLERYVRKNKLDPQVVFKGHISEEAKPKLLSSADVACFPSLYGESFGIVLVEAMAAGAGTILGGNNPGYASVLGDHQAMLINPKETKEFAKRLELLLTDKRLRNQLHKWQQSQLKKYDVASVGPKIEALYYQTIANHARSGHN